MIVDFHNHFFPPAYLAALDSGKHKTWVEKNGSDNQILTTANFRNLLDKAHYTIEARLAAMDAHKVDMQCLTFTIPGVHHEDPTEGVRLAQIVNDGFAQVIQQFPTRFNGLSNTAFTRPNCRCSRIGAGGDSTWPTRRHAVFPHQRPATGCP